MRLGERVELIQRRDECDDHEIDVGDGRKAILEDGRSGRI
jgi:hypothetical protein